MTVNDLAHKLEVLRQSFLQQLPGRLDEIDTHWKGRVVPGDPKELSTLHRLVHSLTGTSGTFGLMELSEYSRTVEQQLKSLVQNDSPLNAETWEHLGTLLAGLRSYGVDAAPRDVSSAKAVTQKVFPVHEVDARVLLLSRDDELIADLSAQIGYFGYELSIAAEVDALAALPQESHPVALIIDAESQAEICKDCAAISALRDRYGPSLVVIFIANTGDLEERVQAVRAGGDAYLLKPLDVTVLVDHLDRLTGSHEQEPYRVLVVDDDPTLAQRYALLLEDAGMNVATVTRSMEIMPAMVDLNPDLILMDLYMPDCSGTELARVIRQQDAYVSLPIMFLSSETNLDKQFEAMSLGGDDFLTKPIKDTHLIKAVSNRAARSRLIHSLMARDSLTGLLKHTKIKEALEVEISRSRRQGTPLSFVMLDIDHFKRVNDSYGHLAGDRVIKSLGHLLRQRLRKTDIIGRYGGEEFAVIMPDTDEDEALKVIDSVRVGFSMIRHTWFEEQIACTFSAGIASARDFPEVNELNKAADDVLYRAKGAGRNQVMKYSE